MKKIRIYIDEDAMSHALVNGLRARDVDVTTVLEQGMTGRDDLPQLEYACLQGRVFYTYNVGHFCHLHTQYMTEGKNHAGIIVVNRLRYSIGQQIRRLSNIVQAISIEEIKNTLQFL